MEPIDAIIFRRAAQFEDEAMQFQAARDSAGRAPVDGSPAPPEDSARAHQLDQHAREFGFGDDAIRLSFHELRASLELLSSDQHFPALTARGRGLAAALGAVSRAA